MSDQSPATLRRLSSEQARQRAKKHEEQLALLVQAVELIEGYAIFMLDSKGYIQTWNAGARRLKGYNDDEILGKHFSIFYTPEDRLRNHPAEELKIVEAEGRYREEGWRVRKDGSRFWASVLITRVQDTEGRLVGFSKVTADLTERKMAEEQLRASEERFRLLVEGVSDYAIFMLDPQGRVTTWNRGAERLKGYEAREVIGLHFSVFYTPEEVKQGRPEEALRTARELGQHEDQGWRVRKDGTRFWASALITVLKNSAGEVIGYSKVTRDLTERKIAEDALRTANEDLDRRVRERTAQLAEREKLLKQAVQTRDEFLSMATHELKTPVTSLLLQLQMLERMLKKAREQTTSTENLGKAFQTVYRQISRLTTLVDDLMDVSRVQAGRLKFYFQPLEWAELIRDVMQRMSYSLERAGCTVKMDLQEGVIGSIDAHRMDQVITNLLSNIVKYAPNSQVEVMLRRVGNIAVLRIGDTGPGISQESLARIFEPFERAVSREHVQSGMGLGLFIVKAIVEGHHGTISAHSAPDQGTVFTIHIPLS